VTFLDRLLHRREADATHTRRAPAVAVTSWNTEARTFAAVLSTGAPVERQDARGAYDELLDLNGASLPDRIPLLDSHARDSVDRVLGHVANMRVVNGELVGTATLSRHNPQAQRIAQEIGDGARFGLSIGYRVSKWTDGTRDGRRTRTAAQWDVLEASLVAVGADDRAGMREETVMTTRTTPAPGSRAATNAELRTIASTARLTREHADAWIDRDLTVEAARAEAFQAMRDRTEPASRIVTVTRTRELDDPQERVRAMGEAIYMRSNPAHRPSDRARQYAGLSLVEMARESLRANGISTTGLSAATVIERATGGMVGLHTTSDFALALGDSVGRVIRESYAAAPSPLRQVVRRVTVPDFRDRAVIRMTGASPWRRSTKPGSSRAVRCSRRARLTASRLMASFSRFRGRRSSTTTRAR
jgi:HK97 family phage prohead protease